MKVHYLPKYSPDTKPIERVWRLHEAVTATTGVTRCRNYSTSRSTGLIPALASGFSPTRTRKALENEHYFRIWREVF